MSYLVAWLFIVTFIIGIAVLIIFICDDGFESSFDRFKDSIFGIGYSCSDCKNGIRRKNPINMEPIYLCSACKDPYTGSPLPTREARYSKNCRAFAKPVVFINEESSQK